MDKHAAAFHRGHEQGTVGAVAMDRNGQLFAATSTGGTCCKLPGRVGDSPLILQPTIHSQAATESAITAARASEILDGLSIHPACPMAMSKAMAASLPRCSPVQKRVAFGEAGATPNEESSRSVSTFTLPQQGWSDHFARMKE